MATVITDNTDLKSIEEILKNFNGDDQVDIYSTAMSPIERAIVINDLQISKVSIQRESKRILFFLNNGTILERGIDETNGLSSGTEGQWNNFQLMGDGVIWEDIPMADISLKKLIQEELEQKFNLQIA